MKLVFVHIFVKGFDTCFYRSSSCASDQLHIVCSLFAFANVKWSTPHARHLPNYKQSHSFHHIPGRCDVFHSRNTAPILDAFSVVIFHRIGRASNEFITISKFECILCGTHDTRPHVLISHQLNEVDSSTTSSPSHFSFSARKVKK